MSILVDSHVALWWLDGDNRLGNTCKSLLVKEEVFVSVVTPWELGIKKALGKLEYPEGLSEALVDSGFKLLRIEAAHAELAPTLEMHHRDPFDRMIIAQALTENMKIATADREMGMYKVKKIDALV